MLSALAGLLAGMVHVFSGPDHIAAVAPLAAAANRRAWRAGVRWGLGHTAGVVMVGVTLLLLREALPVALLSAWSERLVGATLVAIGLWGLMQAAAKRLHSHGHAHPGVRHEHAHLHGPGRAHGERRAHTHAHAALAVGALHGLAGSSHLLGVLPALALPSRASAVAYLAGFGVGTIGAMAAFSAAVGFLGAASAAGGGTRVRGGLLGLCSVAAVVVGAVWLVS